MPSGQVRRACVKDFGGRGHGREKGGTKAWGAEQRLSAHTGDVRRGQTVLTFGKCV